MTLTGAVLAALPDVVLLDLDLGPIGSGRDLVGPLVEAGARVLVVSASTDEAMIGECLARGAAGWLPKDVDFDLLLETSRAVAAGRPVMSDRERHRLLDLARQRRLAEAERWRPFAQLSRREAEVLAALVAGQAVDRIARSSYVSVATVRSQVKAVLLKLGVNSQLEAVAMATKAGWIPTGHRQG